MIEKEGEKQTKKETEVIIQELAKRQIEKDQNKKIYQTL